MEQVDVAAVCDTNKKKVQWVAEKFGVERYGTSLDELLKMDDIDAVDVCVPTEKHMDVVLAALSAGKHVLVEKPMALNHQQAEKMVAAAEKYDRRLMVAMNVRFREDSLVLHKFTARGELGDIFYVKAGWLRRKQDLSHKALYEWQKRSGGGVLMDLGIQMLDVGLWLMGNQPAKSVKSAVYSNVTGLEVEDSAAAFISLKNGATLTVEVSWTLLSDKDFFYTNLFGANGGALLNPLRIHKELHGSLVNVTPVKKESPENLYKRSYENELRQFAECILEGTEVISSGEEQLERMRILDAIYRSAQSGEEVSL